MRQRLLVWAPIPLLGLVLVGCGTGAAGPPASERPAAAAGTATVAIEDLAFAPAEQIVQVGTTVQWLWDDGAIAHNVVGDGWASEVQQAGTFSQRFDQPGDYAYLCTLHPNMTGTIEVRT